MEFFEIVKSLCKPVNNLQNIRLLYWFCRITSRAEQILLAVIPQDEIEVITCRRPCCRMFTLILQFYFDVCVYIVNNKGIANNNITAQYYSCNLRCNNVDLKFIFFTWVTGESCVLNVLSAVTTVNFSILPLCKHIKV